MVADDTFEGLGPVFVGAGRAGPVLGVSVEPVTVVIFLTGICSDGWASRATSGARGLGGLCGTAWLLRVVSLMGCMLSVLLLLLLTVLPLAQTLGAPNGARPVQVGAHVAGPLATNLGYVGDADARSRARVGADEQAGASLGRAIAEIRRDVQAGIERGAALEGLLGDDGTPAGPLSAAHGALDGRRPVLVCAVFAGPLGNQFGHRHTAAKGGFLPLRGALSSADPLLRRSHSKLDTGKEREDFNKMPRCATNT